MPATLTTPTDTTDLRTIARDIRRTIGAMAHLDDSAEPTRYRLRELLGRVERRIDDGETCD